MTGIDFGLIWDKTHERPEFHYDVLWWCLLSHLVGQLDLAVGGEGGGGPGGVGQAHAGRLVAAPGPQVTGSCHSWHLSSISAEYWADNTMGRNRVVLTRKYTLSIIQEHKNWAYWFKVGFQMRECCLLF